jgi:hypothetical protein
VGAAVATGKSKTPEEGSVAASYWLILIFLTLITVGIASASSVGLGLIIALLFLPLLQLAASVVTAVWIQMRSRDLPYKKAGLQALKRITLWSFLWTIAGLAAMFLGFELLRAR